MDPIKQFRGPRPIKSNRAVVHNDKKRPLNVGDLERWESVQAKPLYNGGPGPRAEHHHGVPCSQQLVNGLEGAGDGACDQAVLVAAVMVQHPVKIQGNGTWTALVSHPGASTWHLGVQASCPAIYTTPADRAMVLPMITTALACLLPVFSALNAPIAAPSGSVGLVLSSLEVAGIGASFYVDPSISLDAKLTLVSVDGGLSAHLPFSGPAHAVVLSALGGFRHALLHNSGYLSDVHTGRFTAMAGYGYLGAFDVRVQAGVVTERPHAVAPGWHAGFVLALYAGKTF